MNAHAADSVPEPVESVRLPLPLLPPSILLRAQTSLLVLAVWVAANHANMPCYLVQIHWNAPPKGKYKFWVIAVDCDRHDGPNPCQVRLTRNGIVEEKSIADIRQDETVIVFEFEL
jgi:hypothetical protein